MKKPVNWYREKTKAPNIKEPFEPMKIDEIEYKRRLGILKTKIDIVDKIVLRTVKEREPLRLSSTKTSYVPLKSKREENGIDIKRIRKKARIDK